MTSNYHEEKYVFFYHWVRGTPKIFYNFRRDSPLHFKKVGVLATAAQLWRARQNAKRGGRSHITAQAKTPTCQNLGGNPRKIVKN